MIMKPGSARLCALLLALSGLPGGLAAGDVVYEAQDILNSGRRTASIVGLGESRYRELAGRMDQGTPWSLDLFITGKYYYGFPVVSDYGVMKSDLSQVQASVMTGFRIAEPMPGRSIDAYLGVHGVRLGLSTPVDLPVPAGDPVGEEITVSDFVSDQFYDDMIDFRIVFSSYGMLRAGWVQNEVYAASTDGRIVRDDGHLVSRATKWFFDFDILSLGRFHYRMDSATRLEYWSFSSGIANLLIDWLASGGKRGFFEFLLARRLSPEKDAADALARGLPRVSLSVTAENYYRGLDGTLRGDAREPNLVYELKGLKRFQPGRTIWFDADAILGIYSRTYARWNDSSRLRELSAGIEFSVLLDDGDTLGDTFLVLLQNRTVAGASSVVMRYSLHWGLFADGGFREIDNDASIRTSGFRLGVGFSFWSTLDLDFSYARNDPADLKNFLEARDRGVFMFRLSYRY